MGLDEAGEALRRVFADAGPVLDQEGEARVGLRIVAEALGIPWKSAKAWAFAAVKPTQGAYWLTLAEAQALAADPTGVEALRREVCRLRKEVRRWRSDAERRADLRERRAREQEALRAGVTRLRDSNRKKGKGTT